MEKIICTHCGYDQNDIILTKCLVCNKNLPNLNINTVSDEDIVLNTGEWLGKVGDSSVQTNQEFNIWESAFFKLKNDYLGIKVGGYDKGLVEIPKRKIEEIALKYLTILEGRTKLNPSLNSVYITLKSEYDKKKRNVFNILGGQNFAACYFNVSNNSWTYYYGV